MFLYLVLQVDANITEYVLLSIGDNCNLNGFIGIKIGIPLLGRASHRFQLAVRQILNKNEVILKQVHQLMAKLRKLLLYSKLYYVTNLKPKVRDETR